MERVGIRDGRGWFIFPTDTFYVEERGRTLVIETELGKTTLVNLVNNPKDALIEGINEGRELIEIHSPGSGDDGTEGDGA